MRNFLLGIAIASLFLATGFYFFISSGLMPVATKGKPLPLERWIAKKSIHAAMKGQTNIVSPFEMDEKKYLSAAQTYAMNCGVCHGFPKSDATAVADGLYPKPPQFFEKGEDVNDDSVGEIYWFVKNGVRLTGMPGFENSLSNEDLWELTLFLKNTDKLPKSTMDFLED